MFSREFHCWNWLYFVMFGRSIFVDEAEL